MCAHTLRLREISPRSSRRSRSSLRSSRNPHERRLGSEQIQTSGGQKGRRVPPTRSLAPQGWGKLFEIRSNRRESSCRSGSSPQPQSCRWKLCGYHRLPDLLLLIRSADLAGTSHLERSRRELCAGLSAESRAKVLVSSERWFQTGIRRRRVEEDGRGRQAQGPCSRICRQYLPEGEHGRVEAVRGKEWF